MILANATWQDVDAFDRSGVVLIPTGSLEQHGPHLPLFTDSLIATAVGRNIEEKLPEGILLTPTLWLGASGHHLRFAGTLSATMETYMGAIASVVESLLPHGFRKFYVINAHGGNNEPNGVALRSLKARYSDATFGHSGYYAFVADEVAGTLEGPLKEMRHACEAEASLMMHLHPDLVRTDKLRDDGLWSEPPLRGVIHHFDEMTEEGSFGYATFASAEKGRFILEAAVEKILLELRAVIHGYRLIAAEPLPQ
jgi:creatinine amidohydrolase